MPAFLRERHKYLLYTYLDIGVKHCSHQEDRRVDYGNVTRMCLDKQKRNTFTQPSSRQGDPCEWHRTPDRPGFGYFSTLAADEARHLF